MFNNLSRCFYFHRIIRKYLFISEVLSLFLLKVTLLFISSRKFNLINVSPYLPIHLCFISTANHVFKWPRGSQLCMLASTFKWHNLWCLFQLSWGLCGPRSPWTFRIPTHRIIPYTGKVVCVAGWGCVCLPRLGMCLFYSFPGNVFNHLIHPHSW